MLKHCFVIAVIAACVHADGPVLKTGQSTEVQSGDDGMYQRGKVRTYSRSAEGVVSDHATNLEWQDDYSDNGDTVKEARLWSDAVDYCAALDLNGSGWRLPKKFELIMLTDRGKSGPVIDAVFENTISTYAYWSATEYDANSSFAWKVSFFSGLDAAPLKTDTTYPVYVRCVRGEGGVIQSAYVRDDGNATVYDDVSMLEWQDDASVETQLYNWSDAVNHCETLGFATHDDWRLPNLNELWSIVDLQQHFPAIDPAFAHTSTTKCYWSSTSYAPSTSYGWNIHFNYGFNTSPLKNDTLCYARCVRAGEGEGINPSAIMYLLD